ncbi:MAG: NTP transferase domain-containing protein [Ardenticatenaceae bacterium]|nr:NTP transferase domain-containing protein [Ardenticatenaceae bacterium]
MDCVITAGGVPGPEDPLFPYTQGKTKALLDMNGRTMLERVIDALQDSQHIDNIVVVGLGSDMGMTFKRPVQHLPDQGSLIGNGLAGFRLLKAQNPDIGHVLFSSADVPRLTGSIVDHFIQTCQPLDRYMYYNFVTQEVMETRFPHSRRTFVKLKGARVAGGDIAIMHADLIETHIELWEALSQGRKHAWMLARVVGFGFLFKFLLRQVGIADIEETAVRILQRPVQIIVNPHAEIAMDADKPYQVDLLRDDFSKQ